MSPNKLANATWRKSSHSAQSGTCVEIACIRVPDAPADHHRVAPMIVMRDSKNPDGPVLWLAETDWHAFLDSVRDTGSGAARQHRRAEEPCRESPSSAAGGGKSYVARELGRLLDAPVTHLDAEYFDDAWSPLPMEEFEARQRELVAVPRWVIDGNYNSTLHAP